MNRDVDRILAELSRLSFYPGHPSIQVAAVEGERVSLQIGDMLVVRPTNRLAAVLGALPDRMAERQDPDGLDPLLLFWTALLESDTTDVAPSTVTLATHATADFV